MMKRKLITGVLSVLLLAVAAAPAYALPAEDSLSLEFALPEDDAAHDYRLTDGNVDSRISFRSGATMTISFGSAAQALELKFFSAPTRYTLSQMNASGNVLIEESIAGAMLNRCHTLRADCRSAALSFDGACALSEAAVYAADEPLPASVQQWNAFPDAADVLLVCAEPCAEFRDFSGVLPYYAAACGIRTAVVYPYGWHSRTSIEETLSGLWQAGITAYPLFGPWEAPSHDDYGIMEKYWRAKDVTPWISEIISALAPKVIVTHGTDALENDPAAIRISELVQQAVMERSAATASVQKLYLCSDGGATAPPFASALTRYAGQSAAQAAQSVYAAYASQTLYGRAIRDSAFSLAFTTVGDDAERNDLLEHIDTASLLAYSPPALYEDTLPAQPAMPEASASPPPTATAVPPQIVAEASASPAPAAVDSASGYNLPIAAIALGSLVSLVLLTVLFSERRAYRVRASRRILLSMLPFFISAAFAGLVLSRAAHSARMPASSPSPAASTAVPTESPAPTASPAPSPTPAPLAEAASYRMPDEPEEVVVFDDEGGHWEYRSDVLRVSIDRFSAEYSGEPVVYFVADVQMKNVYQFRPLFSSGEHSGRGGKLPDLMARESNAVLVFTGDNMVNNELDLKGILIREGTIYSRLQNEDSLAMYPDMSLRILKKGATTARTLQEDGVNNCFSFGPTLIDGGVVNERAAKHRVRRKNPRSAIGMIEPGHYVVIVVDGRQRLSGYSVGMTIWDLADLFATYGCETAYNLDGGVSAGMIFMGRQINSHSGQRTGNPGDISFQRRLPDALAFGYSALVSTMNESGDDEPIGGTNP